MSQTILFGGGDGGGIVIGPNGIRRIPPYDPALRLELRGLSALVNVSAHDPTAHGELGAITARVSTIVVGQVEKIAGRIEGEAGLVYLDEDGGFYCGNGKPPHPLGGPVRTGALSAA